jgi:hypothetical protein
MMRLTGLKENAYREPVCLSPRMFVAIRSTPCLIDCFAHPQQGAQCCGKSTSSKPWSDSPASTYLTQGVDTDAPGVSHFLTCALAGDGVP